MKVSIIDFLNLKTLFDLFPKGKEHLHGTMVILEIAIREELGIGPFEDFQSHFCTELSEELSAQVEELREAVTEK